MDQIISKTNNQQNQAKESKIQKTTTTKPIGEGKFTKTVETKPGKGPGQQGGVYKV